MNRISVCSAIAAAFSFLTVSIAQADPEKVDILVSPAGSGPYLAWATMQNYAPDYSKAIQPMAVETPGFTYNVRFLASSPDLWKNTLIGSGEVVEWAAANGVKPFFPEPLKVVEDFRVIGVMSQSTNVFVTLDDKIETIDDMAGKRVAVGLLTQNEWGMHQRMLLDAWGITPKLRSFDALGPGQNIDAMLDGRSDIGTLVVHSSLNFGSNLEAAPFKTLESAGRPWHYINIPAEKIEEYNSSKGAPFAIRKVPAKTLSGQNGEFTSFGNYTLLTAHKSFPDDLAYEMAKLWISSGPSLGKYSAIAKIWDPETISIMARTSPERIHPGAMRAYVEAGLIKK